MSFLASRLGPGQIRAGVTRPGLTALREICCAANLVLQVCEHDSIEFTSVRSYSRGDRPALFNAYCQVGHQYTCKGCALMGRAEIALLSERPILPFVPIAR